MAVGVPFAFGCAVYHMLAAEHATRNRRRPAHRLESMPHLTAAAARHQAKTEMMAALRHGFYAACRHV